MGKRGPKPLKPTAEQRDRVRLYAAGGVSEPVIAHRLGICQNTLRTHFGEDLIFGRETKIAENLDRLDKAADSGNVTAMKHLDQRFLTAETSRDEMGRKMAPALGKKDQALQDAQNPDRTSALGDLMARRTAVN